MKHIDYGIKYSIDLHCTDRGQHESARIGSLVEWYDGTIQDRRLSGRKGREALRRHHGFTVTDKRIKMRPPNIAEVKEQIRKDLAADAEARASEDLIDHLATSNPWARAAAMERLLPDRTLEIVCPACGRNPQVSAALLRRIWPELVAANLGRVDISALPF